MVSREDAAIREASRAIERALEALELDTGRTVAGLCINAVHVQPLGGATQIVRRVEVELMPSPGSGWTTN